MTYDDKRGNMTYYFPTFDEIDSLRKDYVHAFLAARRVNSMFYRGDDSMGSFCAQEDYDAIEDDDEMEHER